MALFKISRGKKTDLSTNKPTIKDGNAYFTTDEGYFYIDVGEDGASAVEGLNTTDGANRILINEWHNVDILNCGDSNC